MQLFDVNILVSAFRRDAADHASFVAWLQERIDGDLPFGIPDQVTSGFLRIVTHPRVFKEPSTIDEALAFAEQVRASPSRIDIAPGRRHWEIFSRLCSTGGVRGNLVPDAFLAAIAIESGSEWITIDRDYARFPGLRWRHPFA